MTRQIIATLLAAVLMGGFFFVMAPPARAACQTMIASWYGAESGDKTASGELFHDGRHMTAAHRTLPFGTKLRVTYQGKSVVVRVNDRGPFLKGRSLDLSHAAALKIGMETAGVARVCVEKVG